MEGGRRSAPDEGADEEEGEGGEGWGDECAEQIERVAHADAHATLDRDEIAPVDVEEVEPLDEASKGLRPADLPEVLKHAKALREANQDLCKRRDDRCVAREQPAHPIQLPAQQPVRGGANTTTSAVVTHLGVGATWHVRRRDTCVTAPGAPRAEVNSNATQST